MTNAMWNDQSEMGTVSKEVMRANFLSILERPLPLSPQIKCTKDPEVENGIIYERLLVQTEEAEWAPLLIAKVIG